MDYVKVVSRYSFHSFRSNVNWDWSTIKYIYIANVLTRLLGETTDDTE